MQNMPSNALDNLAIVIPILLVLIAAVILYLVLRVRAVIDMLRCDAHRVLLAFAFPALTPFPLILVMGIMVLTFWHNHKRDILTGKRQTR